MTIHLNHRSEIVLDGVPTGYIAVRNVVTAQVQRIVKCSSNRDLAMPSQTYAIADEAFERDFRVAYESA
ncbi:hypothetical protein ACU4GI_32970 [Cupriavidus basilensis]